MRYQTIPVFVDAEKKYRKDGSFDYLVTWPEGDKQIYDPKTFATLFTPVENGSDVVTTTKTYETDLTLEETEDHIQIIQSTTYFVPKGYAVKHEDGKLSIKPPKED